MNNIFERSIWDGTNAERLAFTPDLDDTIFFETDTDTAYWWEGGAWHPFGGGGGGVGPPTEGPGIDIVAPAQVGLGGDSFLLYDDETAAPVAEYATLTLALAAAVTGQMVEAPGGSYTETVTIPAGVTVCSKGNNTVIHGVITLGGDDSHLKGIIVIYSATSAGDIAGVVGPAAGTGLINDCSIVVTNDGTGDAYGILMGAGDLFVKNITSEAYATGGGDGYGIVGGAGNCYLNEGCRIEGTTDRLFGDNFYDYNQDTLIRLCNADGSTELIFPFSETGLSAALAAATIGDIVILPAGKITLSGQNYTPGAELDNGAVTVDSENGNTISGLIIGDKYCIDDYNGPYNTRPEYGEILCYDIQLSNDGGAVWDARVGRHHDEVSVTLLLGSWGAYAEAIDANYGRLYFQATATSIKVRAYDSANWADNTGTISWKLRSATFGSDIITVPAGVELIGLGENSILDGNVQNNGIITNLKVTNMISGSGTVRMVSNPIAQLFNKQIKSTVLSGSSPFIVSSDTMNVNLNADLLDGYHADELMAAADFDAILTANGEVLVDANGNVLTED